MIENPSDARGPDQTDAPEPPSKSSRKREMHALQALGEQLVALSAERLGKVPLPDALRQAVLDARRFTKHEARRRQMQYIGKLMRNVDPEPIQARLDAFNGVSRAEVARQHQLERLRDEFLDDEKTISAIHEIWPDADLQQLRVLRRNALRERSLSKPPRAYRELFRVLRALQEGGADGSARDETDIDIDEDEDRT